METFNYFNYFTEIEEYFWRKRGAHLLVSPLDWAIVETWQKAGVPLEAVLKGIDRAFESWSRSRRAVGGRRPSPVADDDIRLAIVGAIGDLPVGRDPGGARHLGGQRQS